MTGNGDMPVLELRCHDCGATYIARNPDAIVAWVLDHHCDTDQQADDDG